MLQHLQTGKIGEALAVDYLKNKGYNIIEKNWRHSRWEVDIIASKNTTLHFIEIKTRRNKKYGLPEDKVGKKKIQNLINAAEQYVYKYPKWQRIQFDVLAILLNGQQPADFFLIEDVYI
jgi:putative endonuclease